MNKAWKVVTIAFLSFLANSTFACMLVLENSEWRNGEQYGNCRCAGDFTNLGYGTWRQCYEKTERISREEQEAKEDAAKAAKQAAEDAAAKEAAVKEAAEQEAAARVAAASKGTKKVVKPSQSKASTVNKKSDQ